MSNIFNHIFKLFSDKEQRGLDKLSAEKNMKDIDLERHKIESEFDNKNQQLLDTFKSERINYDTESEYLNAFEEKQGLLQEQKNHELGKLDINKIYNENFIREKEKSGLLNWIKDNKVKFIISIVVFAYVFLFITNSKILISETKVIVGQDYYVEGWGNLGDSNQDSLACRYFNGRKILDRVYWYSPNNILGRDSCPVLLRD